jgi:hypothetical protein
MHKKNRFSLLKTAMHYAVGKVAAAADIVGAARETQDRNKLMQ